MRDEFSTLDICKALDIPRERLRSWMKEDFIKPSVPAQGQGTKAVFTRIDVYTVGLFKSLLEQGYKRETVAVICNRIKKFFIEAKKDYLSTSLPTGGLDFGKYASLAYLIVRTHRTDEGKKAGIYISFSGEFFGFCPREGDFYKPMFSSDKHKTELGPFESKEKKVWEAYTDYITFVLEENLDDRVETAFLIDKRAPVIGSINENWESITLINFKKLMEKINLKLKDLE